MQILITGGAGFIGSHLCEQLLDEGDYILCFDNLSGGSLSNIKHLLDFKEFKFIQADVRDEDSVKEYVKDCDLVFHLAAQIHVDKSYIDPNLTWDVNVRGTQNILEAARFYNKRVIFASSSEVYGSAQYDPMDENHPLDAPHPYGASKIAADRLCFSYNKTYNMPITICRFFNIFGPRQRDIGYGGVISLFLRKSLQNIPLMIYGDGSQVRDYLYITDAIAAYKTVLSRNAGLGPYNFGTCRYISILEIAKMISDNIVFDKSRPSEVKKLICNYAKANKELGWEPKIGFEDGLEKFKQWFRIYGLQDKI